MLDRIQRTRDVKWPIIPRLVAGLPLTLFGLMHLVGASPVEPLLVAARLPMPGLGAIVAPAMEIAAGLLLTFGWLTRVGGGLGVLAMVGAITVHFLIPNDQWPHPASGRPGPEPLGIFLLAWIILGSALVSTIRGGGLWSADRRQVATRASARGGGLDGPRVQRARRTKDEPVKDGDSVW